MATTHPELAAQWHPTKNGSLTPSEVMAGTNRNMWWRCRHGHEWEAPGGNRAKGVGCPYCAGKAAWPGESDMATTHPELAAQWHPTKNGSLTPRDVMAGSEKKVWWVCEEGHEWPATCASRRRGNGCPHCAGKVIVVGVNDLATTHPELAAQWHPTKNGSLTPRDVMAGSAARAWWLCDEGHEWEVAVNGRGVNGNGCRICSGQVVWVGRTDMATTHPELAKEWHPTKNGSLMPQDVIAGTGRKLWWKCDAGHEWQALGYSRAVNGTGCPSCTTYGYDPTRSALLYFLENSSLAARKVGITNVGTSRLEAFGKAGWQPLLLVQHDNGGLVRQVEAAMLKWLRKEHALPQHLGPEDMGREGGWTETFSEEGPSNAEVIARIRAEFARLGSETPTELDEAIDVVKPKRTRGTKRQ